MAYYSVATTALALGIDRKRLENILLRCTVPGTACGRQGRPRRLGRPAIKALAVIIQLQDRLGVPAAAAAALLPELLDGSPFPAATRGPVQLRLDVTMLERDVAAGIAAAVEMAPRPRRGRPRNGRSVRMTSTPN